MSSTKLPLRSLQKLRQEYSSALHQFIASSRDFLVLDTVSRRDSPRPSSPDALYVLDSSFNPPTLAHLRIARSALAQHNNGSSARLLLLLATQNADKPSKPALFEDRLVMMNLFAQDLRASLNDHLKSSDLSIDNAPAVDIGVTKLPYFIDKAAAISAAQTYPDGLEQIHLTGYDTLIRIFNPKYYPPTHTLQPLGPFLSQHRLRVTLRPDDDWGGKEEQESFLRDLAQGVMEVDGGKREWAERIEFVEGKKPGEQVVSSTMARNAMRDDVGALDGLVTPNVRDWMVAQGLYMND